MPFGLMFGTRDSWPGLAGVLVLACLVGCAEQEPSAPAVADADGPLSGAEVAPSAAQQGLREMIEAHANLERPADLPTEGASVEDPRSKVSAIELEGELRCLAVHFADQAEQLGRAQERLLASRGVGRVWLQQRLRSLRARPGGEQRVDRLVAFHEAQVCRDGKASRPLLAGLELNPASPKTEVSGRGGNTGAN